MKFILMIALMWPLLGAGAQTLVNISDPAGDDIGAGKLVYPRRADFKSGDLDILQLQVRRDLHGYWFEAMFRNPIQEPAAASNPGSPEALVNSFRKGFYQFNIDIYVDMDRVHGSGNTFTLPGRQVSIAPQYAWEKAVLLTPRPELIRGQLLNALAEQYPERKSEEIEASVDQALVFPTRIRVHGKSIAFFVPASFFADSDGKDWAVTALVTGATTNIPVGLTLFPGSKKPLELLHLGVMQPEQGYPRETFGYSGSKPGAVVDLLAASAEQQMSQLAARNSLAGTAWGAHAREAAQPATSAIAPAAPTAIGQLLQPENSPVAKQQAPAAQAEPGVLQRLQTLQQLYEQKLIDEAEYTQQKQRILQAL